MNIKQLEKAGINAVLALRETKLKKGLPFMINTHDLPPKQKQAFP